MDIKKAQQDFEIIKDYFKNLDSINYQGQDPTERILFDYIDYIKLSPKDFYSYDAYTFETYIVLKKDGTIVNTDNAKLEFRIYERDSIKYSPDDDSQRFHEFLAERGIKFIEDIPYDDYYYEVDVMYKETTLETFKEDFDTFTSAYLAIIDVYTRGGKNRHLPYPGEYSRPLHTHLSRPLKDRYDD